MKLTDDVITLIVARKVANELTSYLDELDAICRVQPLPPHMKDPYMMLVTLIGMTKYKDQIYSDFVQKGFSPQIAMQKTEDHLTQFAMGEVPIQLPTTTSNVIQFKPKDK